MEPAQTTPTAAAGGFNEGLVARALGLPASANPYPVGSREFVLWDEGWRNPEDRRAELLTDPSGLAM